MFLRTKRAQRGQAAGKSPTGTRQPRCGPQVVRAWPGAGGKGGGELTGVGGGQGTREWKGAGLGRWGGRAGQGPEREWVCVRRARQWQQGISDGAGRGRGEGGCGYRLQEYLHVRRLQQQVPQWAVVVGGEDVVFCVNHVQPQGSQVPRLQALTAVVSGLQEVPGRRTQDRWRESAAPPRAGPPSRPGSVSGSEAGGAQGDSVGHPLQGPCTRASP